MTTRNQPEQARTTQNELELPESKTAQAERPPPLWLTGIWEACGRPLRLAINAIEKKDTENYMQMLLLKSKFIT